MSPFWSKLDFSGPFEKLFSSLADMALSENMKTLVSAFWGKISSDGSKTPCYNIGFLGPSRIGKTTLTAAMVEEFKRFSHRISQIDSRYLKLSSIDSLTMSRLSERINDLKGGIQKGEFVTGTLTGTSTHEIFKLRFEEGKEKSFQQDFSLHDFPGGWINDPVKIQELNLASWDVLILPIDAAIIMESVETAHKKKARISLCIDQVEGLLTDWVQTRTSPGLCILAPVKCETYFTSPKISSILSDKSQQLYNKITHEYYKETLEIIHRASNVDCLYMPVNTVGCCYLKRPTWTASGELEGVYAISPEPGMNCWKPYGPSYIMLEICVFIAEQLRNLPNSMKNNKICSLVQSVSDLKRVMLDPESTAPEKPYDRKRIIQQGNY